MGGGGAGPAGEPREEEPGPGPRNAQSCSLERGRSHCGAGPLNFCRRLEKIAALNEKTPQCSLEKNLQTTNSHNRRSLESRARRSQTAGGRPAPAVPRAAGL